MPQKRNPDVFELLRARGAWHWQRSLKRSRSREAPLGLSARSAALKAPLFRGIDSCLQTLDILPSALAGVRFNPQNIKLDAGIHAAAAANALVTKENIPFREAYRRVAAKLSDPK